MKFKICNMGEWPLIFNRSKGSNLKKRFNTQPNTKHADSRLLVDQTLLSLSG